MTGQLWLIVSGIVLARLLGTTNRGYLALLVLLPLVLEQIGAAGLPFATAYFVARDPFQTRPIAHLAVRWWLRQSALMVLLQGGILMVYLVHRGSFLWPVAAMSLVIVPSMLAVDYGLALLQGLRRFLAFNVARNLIAATGCSASLAAVLLGLHDFAAIGALLMASYVISGTVVALVSWSAVRRLPSTVASTSLQEFRRFGWRAFIGSIYPFESFRFDQLIVGALFPASGLGLYVVAYAFTNLPRFVTQSLGMVAYPLIASLGDRSSQKKTLLGFTLLASLLAVGAVAGLEIVMGWLVPVLFGQSFVGSVQLARILLPGALCFALRRILAEGLKGAGYPAIGTAAEVAAWVAMVPLAAALIRILGLQGVALAADGAAFISLVTLLYLDWRGPRFAVGRGVPELRDGPAATIS